MKLSVVLSVALMFCLKASANSCVHYLPVNEIISSPDGVMSIDDEGGGREIKSTIYATPDCQTNSLLATGTALFSNSNSTFLTQGSAQSDGCEIKNIGGVLTIDSFQAIVVETNGWPLSDLNMTFDDLDAAGGSWREAGAVFGLRNGEFVAPNLSLVSNSHLALRDYNIPAASMASMGLSLGSTTVQGAGYNDAAAMNCKIGDPSSTRCTLSISFSSDIDTLVIVYVVLERGSLSSRSGALISPIMTRCGCRCRQTNPGTRSIIVPVEGVPGQCTSRETSRLKTECDVLGDQWCTKEDTTGFTLTGTTLPNGNVECTTDSSTHHKVTLHSPFTPDPNFQGTG